MTTYAQGTDVSDEALETTCHKYRELCAAFYAYKHAVYRLGVMPDSVMRPRLRELSHCIGQATPDAIEDRQERRL